MSAASIYAEAMTAECPHCGAMVGKRCSTLLRRRGPARYASRPHQSRLDAAARLRRVSPLPGGEGER